MTKELSQETLKELLHYNLDTGLFIWKVRGRGIPKSGHAGSTVICNSGKAYIKIGLKGRLYFAHRLAWLYVTGEFARFPEFEIDHIDGCGTNNKFANLRSVTRKENNKNKRLLGNNTVGITGVHWINSRQRWIAQIRVGYRCKHLGYYHTLFAAACARKYAELQYGFHENHGKNRPL